MLSFVLFLCALTSVASSEITSPSPSSPSASTTTLETWELALVIGSGTLALLMCAYSVYIFMRRRRTATPLRRVVVDMEEGGGKKESKTTVAKKESKTVAKKESKTAAKTDAKTTIAKSANNGETSTEVIAVKTQPNKYAVTCPGGGKACIGARKDGVQTIPQPNKLPAPKIRRDSAPSRIASGRNSAPRV